MSIASHVPKHSYRLCQFAKQNESLYRMLEEYDVQVPGSKAFDIDPLGHMSWLCGFSPTS